MGNTEIYSDSLAGFYKSAEMEEEYEKEEKRGDADYTTRVVEVELQQDGGNVKILFKDLDGKSRDTSLSKDSSFMVAVQQVKMAFENAEAESREKQWKIGILKGREDFKDIRSDFFKDVNPSDKLSSYLEGEKSVNAYVCYQYQGLSNLPNTNGTPTKKLAMPFQNPFFYYLFENKGDDSYFQIIKPNKKVLEESKLNGISNSTAFCNGKNSLYLSGGEDISGKFEKGKTTNDFWAINLDENRVYHHENGLPFNKKNHSMIFIPNQYVFFVGGEDKSTFFYDTESQLFSKWADLNELAICPTLAILNQRYLLCFSNHKRKNNENFYEITDLKAEKPKWQKRNLDTKKDVEKLNQKYFAMCPFENSSFVQVGGFFGIDAMNKIKADEKKAKKGENVYPCASLKCSHPAGNKDSVELMDKKSPQCYFKEKFFHQLDDDVWGLIPQFARQEPKIILFLKGDREFKERKFRLKDGVIDLESSGMPRTSLKANKFDQKLENLVGFEGLDLTKPLNPQTEIPKTNIQSSTNLRSSRRTPAYEEEIVDNRRSGSLRSSRIQEFPKSRRLDTDQNKKEEYPKYRDLSKTTGNIAEIPRNRYSTSANRDTLRSTRKIIPHYQTYGDDDEGLTRNLHNVHKKTELPKQPRVTERSHIYEAPKKRRPPVREEPVVPIRPRIYEKPKRKIQTVEVDNDDNQRYRRARRAQPEPEPEPEISEYESYYTEEEIEIEEIIETKPPKPEPIPEPEPEKEKKLRKAKKKKPGKLLKSSLINKNESLGVKQEIPGVKKKEMSSSSIGISKDFNPKGKDKLTSSYNAGIAGKKSSFMS